MTHQTLILTSNDFIQLLKLLTTHEVGEKEIYNQKLSTKILDELTPVEIRDLNFVFDTFDANSDK